VSVVLDGSAALAILLPDERGGKAAAAIFKSLNEAEEIFVPAHWWIETANGVLVAERRGRLTQMESVTALVDAHELEPATDLESGARTTRDVLALARLHSLTAYDAAYLELAMRKKAKLETLDAALRRAALKAGVSVTGA
jgi:predicted nucleic acid-binding protein